MGRGPVGAPAIIRYVNNSLASVDDVSGIDDSMVLIKTLTASSSSTLSFVDGTSDVVLDNTYPIYKFVWINIHPSADNTKIQFQGNAAGGSGYDETITRTSWYARHDESCTGTLHLYDPSNTTFVKHFISRVSNYEGSDYAMEAYVAGYCNVTAAIDGVQFKFDSGNIDAGTFKLYGVV